MDPHAAVEPSSAADIEEDRGVLGPPDVHHVSHVQMVDIAEKQLCTCQLRYDLQLAVPQGVEDLLRLVLPAGVATMDKEDDVRLQHPR